MFVYLLTNAINGKYYVGKTVSKNLNRYLKYHPHGVSAPWPPALQGAGFLFERRAGDSNSIPARNPGV